MDGPDCKHYAPTPGLDLVKGVLSHAAAAGKSKDHVVAVVDVRRAYFYAEPLPKTFVELPGPRSHVDAVRNSLRKRYEIREQMLGAGPKDASEIIMLNRRVQWTEAGIRISPDPRCEGHH